MLSPYSGFSLLNIIEQVPEAKSRNVTATEREDLGSQSGPDRGFVLSIGLPNPNVLIRELVDVSHPKNFTISFNE